MEYLASFFGGSKKQKETDRFTDKFFIDQIKQTKLLEEKSKLLYLNKLNIIRHEIFDNQHSLYWILTHPEESSKEIVKWCSQQTGRNGRKGLSPNTAKQYCALMISLILHHQEIQELKPTLIKQWRTITEKVAQPYTDQVESNEPNAKQLKALVPFSQIEKIRDDLPSGSDGRLLLSLYTMIEPIRSNFDRVWINKTPADANYLDLKKHQLILNQYKTVKIYGKMTIDLPDTLMTEIQASLHKNPRELLFVMKNGKPYDKTGTFNRWANRLLKNVLHNQQFSLTMFRHIWLSRPNLHLGKMTLKQKKVIAEKMGHSTEQQAKYQWKSDNPKDFSDTESDESDESDSS